MLPHSMAIASMFGKPSQMVNHAIQQIHNQVAQTSIGQTQFFQSAQAAFHDMSVGKTAKMIDNMRAQSVIVMEIDRYSILHDAAQIQLAENKMRRGIMAHPVIRDQYQLGNIDGYSGLYVDSQPGAIGADHYDYRLHYSGIMQTEHNEDGTTTSTATSFFETHREEYSVDFHNRVAVHITTQNAVALIEEQDYDPTLVENEMY